MASASSGVAAVSTHNCHAEMRIVRRDSTSSTGAQPDNVRQRNRRGPKQR